MSTQNTLSKPNPSKRLSSIEFRRYVNGINTLERLIDSKEYLVRYIISKFRIKECVDQFSEELEAMLENHDPILDIGYIRIWILKYAYTIEGHNYNDPERPVYEFLQSNYSDINETFHEFYDKYASYTADKPLGKNHVSRALNALGIKAILKKLRTADNKPKCFMVLRKTKEELSEILINNGLIPA